MEALQELLQTGGTGSSATERTEGHEEEQISVLSFWVVGFFLFFVVSCCDFSSFALTRISEFGRFLKIPDTLVPSHF